MQIGILNETTVSEARVALTPDAVAKLGKLGYQVLVETAAGAAASFPDAAYQAAGAQIVARTQALAADVLLAINAPEPALLAQAKSGALFVSFMQPRTNQPLIDAALANNLTYLAMDMVPRISRAQAMDALSSLGNIAGYRGVIEAAAQFGRFFNGQITAAGKIPPAKVLVIGAGVAGLAAIGAAKNLGAQVRAFDARAEVKEQVESMGAKFLVVDVEQQKSADGYARETTAEFDAAAARLYAQQAKEVDVIITTANIPGRKAPELITAEMVASMKPGSVIVDLAAQTGGNCVLTQKDKLVVTDNGVKIVGYTNFHSKLALQASTLYANNLVNLFTLLTPNKDGNYQLDLADVIVRNMTVTLAAGAPALNLPAEVKVVEAPAAVEEQAAVEKQAAQETPAVEEPAVEEPAAAKLEQASDEPAATKLPNLQAQAAEVAESVIETAAEEAVPAHPQVAEPTLLFPPPPISVSAGQTNKTAAAPVTTQAVETPAQKRKRTLRRFVGILVAVLVYIYLSANLPSMFIGNLNTFVVASVLGYFIIWNVKPALHTPLMSLTNALSGIVLVGALLQLTDSGSFSVILGLVAIWFAAMNVFGGFAVTNRMLKMFIKKEGK